MNDYMWTWTKGRYWIHFDKQPDGVRAEASGPMDDVAGVANSVGPRVARKTADTAEKAKELLIAELKRLTA